MIESLIMVAYQRQVYADYRTELTLTRAFPSANAAFAGSLLGFTPVCYGCRRSPHAYAGLHSERVWMLSQMSGLLRVTLLRVAMLAVLVFAAAAMLSQVLPARVLPAMVNTAYANGASTLLYDQTQGRYRLVVGIIPARPVIPQTHLSMQVFDAAADRVLRDTDIRVLISASGPAGSRQVEPREVVNDVSIVYFETNVAFDVVGPWQVLVEISSDQGEESFLIPVEVGEPGASIQWVWVSAVLVIIVAVGIWTLLTVSRRGREQQ